MPKPLQYKSGSLIYFQGDPADKVFILQSGKVNLVYQDIENGQDVHDLVQPGEWVLLPRARGARNVLPEALHQFKAVVNEVFLYEAKAEIKVSQSTLDRIMEGEADYLTFTSSSTVRNFVRIVGAENVDRISKNLQVACIGPITAATAAEYGFKNVITARVYTIPGLIQAILKA